VVVTPNSQTPEIMFLWIMGSGLVTVGSLLRSRSQRMQDRAKLKANKLAV
jgi:hypothetical protein